MKPVFLAPKELMQRKPAHGAPCTRCGLCCMATLCDLAQHVFQREEMPGPCPALVQQGRDFVCGIAVVSDAAATRESAELLIGAGLGCDARFNGEPASFSFYKKLKQHDAANAAAIRAARKLWGME